MRRSPSAQPHGHLIRSLLLAVPGLMVAILFGPLPGRAAADAGLPAWESPFSTDPVRAYHCLRAEGAIKVDGLLNEPAWDRAQKIQKFLIPPEVQWDTTSPDAPSPILIKAHEAKSATTAMLLWNDEYLFFAARLADEDLYGTQGPGHDLPFGTNDVCELFIKPKDDLPYYWEFHLTPRGTSRDYFYARRSAGGDERWMSYESGMKAAVTVKGTINHWEDRDHGYTVEMAIPWSAFDRMGGQPKPGDHWRFLVSRYDYSVYLEAGVELSAAASLPRAAYHLYEYYPCLVFDQ
jgi:hypothetical protein